MLEDGLIMIPSKPGTCQICATEHAFDEPHNQRSLPYQMIFKSKYNRGATWADAISHCPTDISAEWKAELLKIGIWSEPKDKRPIAIEPVIQLVKAGK